MGRELLKWLGALALGAATAALTWIGANVGHPGGIDPLIAGVLVAGLKRIVDFLVSKLPPKSEPALPPPSATRARKPGEY